MIVSLMEASALEKYDLTLLTKEEIEHIRKAKIPLLQSCRAHACFEFRKMAGIQTNDAAVLRNAKGQPYFANLDYNISISHKDQHCWLGMVKKPGVIGVDIEKIAETESVEVMFKHVANDLEKEHYQNLTSHFTKEEYLTVLWSLKESLYKCENSQHEGVSFLIDPFQNSAHLNFAPHCRLENLWAGKQMQIKYSIQKPFVLSSIYIFDKEI